MTSIIKIGMDVHSKSYSLCAIEPRIGESDRIIAEHTIPPSSKHVIGFIQKLKQKLGDDADYDITCGYEAGCLGFSLCRELEAAGIKCEILAPTTMLSTAGNRVKTDTRDALLIAKCLAYGGYSAVHIPTDEDNAVRDYIRMRDDHMILLKTVKQEIIAFCMRQGLRYDGTNWTEKHLVWLKNLELNDIYREALNEYLCTYVMQRNNLDRLNRRIEEMAELPKYKEKVQKLICFLGIKTYTALAIVVETGDFARFAHGGTYAAFLGLAPGEHSSGEHSIRTSITKAGNIHLRCLLVESSSAICRGAIGAKSKALRARQNGNPANVIAYADRANIRLRSKYYRLIRHGKKRNVAVTAVARELACFIWGMMTDNID